MKILIVGAGPAGLYFAILMKKQNPKHEIVVLERDGPHDTFGWGIVFSDQTFSYLETSDEPSHRAITEECARWDDVEVAHRGQRITIRGNRFSGIGRLAFLNVLHRRCLELGVDLRFHHTVAELEDLPQHDLLVGADGASSLVRRAHEATFQPTIEHGRNKYMWLGTTQLFQGLTFLFHENEAGGFVAHCYKFSPTTSTFIVECTERTWKNVGFEDKNPDETCAYLSQVFREDLQDHSLLSNNFVKWFNFALVRNRSWYAGHTVLLGDALHTAHFSIGSGTKLALEDSIALAQCFADSSKIEDALSAFEQMRRPVVESYQAASNVSRLFFEQLDESLRLDPIRLAYELVTRSDKITREKLAQRDPAFMAAYEAVVGGRKN